MPRSLNEIIAHIRMVVANPNVSTTLIQTEDLEVLCNAAEGKQEGTMTDYRMRPIRAAFFDGKLVGERQADGTVRPESCPDWFPAVVRETHAANTFLMPGEVIYAGPQLLVGSNKGSERVLPGMWIVSRPGSMGFDVLDQKTFEELYEPAAG